MAKLEELMENEQFCEKMGECANEDALKKLLVENGVSNDEIEQLLVPREDTQEELSEENLEAVSGGAGDIPVGDLLDAIVRNGKKLGKLGAGIVGGISNYWIIWKSNYDYDRHGNMYRTYPERTVNGAIKFWEKALNKMHITY